MRHLGQIGHHRQADDVLAQAHRQLRRRIGIDLRAEDLRQADHLAPRIRQFQRHVVLARDDFDHTDRHQAQRTRQVLGQADDLRSLDASGRLDLVAGDHRAGRGGNDAHLDAEITQLFLDHPRRHLERFGRD